MAKELIKKVKEQKPVVEEEAQVKKFLAHTEKVLISERLGPDHQCTKWPKRKEKNPWCWNGAVVEAKVQKAKLMFEPGKLSYDELEAYLSADILKQLQIPQDQALNYLAHNKYSKEKTLKKLENAQGYFFEFVRREGQKPENDDYIAHLSFQDS